MKNTYAPRTVCKAAGLNPVTLRTWHLFGLQSEGPLVGTRRAYTFNDALAIVVMHRLIRYGIQRKHAAQIVNEQRGNFGGKWWVLVTPGQTEAEYYCYPGRQTSDEDIHRRAGSLGYEGKDSIPKLSKILEPSSPDSPAKFGPKVGPEDVIIISVHEIAADLRRKLDMLA